MIINPFFLPDSRIATFLQLGTIDMDKSKALANADITTTETDTNTVVFVSGIPDEIHRGEVQEVYRPKHAKYTSATMLACDACRVCDTYGNNPMNPKSMILTGYVQVIGANRSKIEVIVDKTININPTDEQQEIITAMFDIMNRRMEVKSNKMTKAYDSFKDVINNAAYRIGFDDKHLRVTSSKSAVRFVPYLDHNDEIYWVPTEVVSRAASKRADLPSIDIVL